MTKSILPILSSCLRGKHFYTGKMTENEHNYKGSTPMNVTYVRFEIQLIDLPRSQASQVCGSKRNCERSGASPNWPCQSAQRTLEWLTYDPYSLQSLSITVTNQSGT